MRAIFQADPEIYALKLGKTYNIDFRNEGLAVFVDVEGSGTAVFPGMQSFLDAWQFEGVQKKSKRVRHFTDFDTTLYFSSGEVAEFLSISKQTVDNWVKAGKLDVAFTVGERGDRRFRREDVIQLHTSLSAGY